jgi:hypothetical protein
MSRLDIKRLDSPRRWLVTQGAARLRPKMMSHAGSSHKQPHDPSAGPQ